MGWCHGDEARLAAAPRGAAQRPKHAAAANRRKKKACVVFNLFFLLLIDAGGDLRASGHPAPGELWRVGVRHPWQTDAVCWVLTGADIAVATSGTYERGPHVIDPRSGKPAVALRSVTVVGSDLAVADAYATAAVAMGTSGLAWLAGLDGYETGVVTEDGACLRSELFPALPDPAILNANSSLE